MPPVMARIRIPTSSNNRGVLLRYQIINPPLAVSVEAPRKEYPQPVLTITLENNGTKIGRTIGLDRNIGKFGIDRLILA
jgi:hypothetical protein